MDVDLTACSRWWTSWLFGEFSSSTMQSTCSELILTLDIGMNQVCLVPGGQVRVQSLLSEEACACGTASGRLP